MSSDSSAIIPKEYSVVGAILIHIPESHSGPLKSGFYSVYSEDHLLVYEKNSQYEGPQFFSSMKILKQSNNMGKYFLSDRTYLSIKALAFHPEDNAVIVSNIDANSIIYANINGSRPDKVFEEGRIALVVEPVDDEKDNQ